MIPALVAAGRSVRGQSHVRDFPRTLERRVIDSPTEKDRAAVLSLWGFLLRRQRDAGQGMDGAKRATARAGKDRGGLAPQIDDPMRLDRTSMATADGDLSDREALSTQLEDTATWRRPRMHTQPVAPPTRDTGCIDTLLDIAESEQQMFSTAARWAATAAAEATLLVALVEGGREGREVDAAFAHLFSEDPDFDVDQLFARLDAPGADPANWTVDGATPATRLAPNPDPAWCDNLDLDAVAAASPAAPATPSRSAPTAIPALTRARAMTDKRAITPTVASAPISEPPPDESAAVDPAETVSADPTSPPLTAVEFLRQASPNRGRPFLALPKYLLSANLIGWMTRVHRSLWPVFSAMLYCLDLSGPIEQHVTATRQRLGELSGISNRKTLRTVLRILEEGAPAQGARRGRPATPALPALFEPGPKGWTWRSDGFEMLRRTCLAVLGHGDRAEVEHALRRSVRGMAAARMRWRREASRNGDTAPRTPRRRAK